MAAAIGLGAACQSNPQASPRGTSEAAAATTASTAQAASTVPIPAADAAPVDAAAVGSRLTKLVASWTPPEGASFAEVAGAPVKIWGSIELDAQAALALWRVAAPRCKGVGGTAVVHEQRRGAQFAKLTVTFETERKAAEALTAEAFFSQREKAYRDQEAKINASLARAKAGKPETKLDHMYVELCKQAPKSCVEVHRVAELEKQRDALSAVPKRSPTAQPYFASSTAARLESDRSYRVYLVATEPWALPLLFQFGAWNDCPRPHEHAAVLRRWHQRFGATPMLLGSDTLELEVPRPPSTLEAVQQVTWQHYLLTEDAIEQGAGDMKTLAVGAVARHWFFWWD